MTPVGRPQPGKLLKVADAGLVHLEGLTHLQYLNVNRTKVTDAGVKKLQAALPHCKIIR